MNDDAQDRLFAALAHRARRRILDLLKAHPGCNVGYVASFFDVSRVAVMKHLRVLEDAGLVVSRKEGRERLLHFNPVPIQEIHERWTTELSEHWASKLTRIKRKVEAASSDAGGSSDER
ncbi:MAG: helix-turn-helix transcriptional regulator [Planctomycetota bacterium]